MIRGLSQIISSKRHFLLAWKRDFVYVVYARLVVFSDQCKNMREKLCSIGPLEFTFGLRMLLAYDVHHAGYIGHLATPY